MKFRRFKHFFLPHTDTHAKAHLISPVGIFVWVALFIILQVSLNLLNTVKPGILGVSANIDNKEIIRLVNEEREKKGLPPLRENDNLNLAAYRKGLNMFEEQYWAHYSPSGKDPWGFITGSGYKYSYAGENLARNFSNAQDAVTAWMNSPTHRDNILNSKYQDIGISVVQGTLHGEQTTIIVQEFGTQVSYTAANPFTEMIAQRTEKEVLSEAQIDLTAQDLPIESSGSGFYANEEETGFAAPAEASELNTPVKIDPTLDEPAINPFNVYRTVGFGVVGILTILLFVDLLVMRKRGVFRPASHHVAHLALLGVAASSLATMSQGMVL